MDEELELISFQIISAVGTARSLYIEAIRLAKDGEFETAEQRIREGQEAFIEGHHAHSALSQQEATGGKVDIPLILVHAEDQLMSAESFGILAEEFLDVYRKIAKE